MEYVVDWILLFLIYILIYFKFLKSKNKIYKIKFFLFCIYIGLVLFSTIMPFKFIIPGQNELFLQRLNLIPFRDIYNNYGGAVDDVILNIIMFIPFGFLISFLKEKTLLKTIILSSLFSFFIELTQLLYSWTTIYSTRTCDITDIITNTIGGILGYLLYKLFKIMMKKIEIIIY